MPKQSNYVKWASLKYPKEAQNVNVDTTMKSYGVLDIFKTASDTDTIKAMDLFGHFILLNHSFH